MEGLSQQAQEQVKIYKAEYRRKNRERINSQQRAWRANNPDKVRQYQRNYWERKAEKSKNIRKTWQDYGISKERLKELQEIVRSGKYESVVLSAAHEADEKAAEHIILSVKENASYETLEAKHALGKINMVPLGRTDFYGARRLFFHYLNCSLKEC